MMRSFLSKLAIAALVMTFAFSFGVSQVSANYLTTPATNNVEIQILWSFYAGWMPHHYADVSGIYQRWGDKYGFSIKLSAPLKYVPSIEAFNAGTAAAVVMTNMDALGFTAAGAGIDVTALILGDFSNGNDVIFGRGITTLKELEGKTVLLEEFSVSQFMLERACELEGVDISKIRIKNAAAEDIETAMLNGEADACVTWNPHAMRIAQEPGINKLFDSSGIPGEILDILFVKTALLEQYPDLGKALVGAWYETMRDMSRRGQAGKDARRIMAEKGGDTLTEYEAQLRTTAMFYRPAEAAAFMEGEEIKVTMEKVRQFCFKYQLLGETARSADVVGIESADGTNMGNRRNVKLRFNSSFTRMAANGEL